jgi:hypothetical protein
MLPRAESFPNGFPNWAYDSYRTESGDAGKMKVKKAVKVPFYLNTTQALTQSANNYTAKHRFIKTAAEATARLAQDLRKEACFDQRFQPGQLIGYLLIGS